MLYASTSTIFHTPMLTCLYRSNKFLIEGEWLCFGTLSRYAASFGNSNNGVIYIYEKDREKYDLF
jgi:hypothetical protein